VHLYHVPLLFMLAGTVLYAVLAGADFGAGFWQLLAAGSSERAQRAREHAHRAMGPVWEANHVWILFVVTVSWAAYPRVFPSVASTASIPLFLAAVGIILRGAAYALREAASRPLEWRRIDTAFALSSVLTPFFLGTVVGGVASRRIPVGNAQGDLISSWLNPTSIVVGCLAVSACAYLAAVYLAADEATRLHAPDLEDYFRARALAAGVVAGALSVAGLAVLHEDAHPLYAQLVGGDGLPAVIAAAAFGIGTLALVHARRYALARYSAAAGVASVVAGWALAQLPTLLPGLTVEQAAAPHDTLVAVTIAVLAGIPLLLPSLVLLFRLTLAGRFDRDESRPAAAAAPAHGAALRSGASIPGLRARSAVACLIAGFGFLNVATAGWAYGVGVAFMAGFVVLGFLALIGQDLSDATAAPEP
jgi:cytochrome d ubiquinol oxidase subunit II